MVFAVFKSYEQTKKWRQMTVNLFSWCTKTTFSSSFQPKVDFIDLMRTKWFLDYQVSTIKYSSDKNHHLMIVFKRHCYLIIKIFLHNFFFFKLIKRRFLLIKLWWLSHLLHKAQGEWNSAQRKPVTVYHEKDKLFLINANDMLMTFCLCTGFTLIR